MAKIQPPKKTPPQQAGTAVAPKTNVTLMPDRAAKKPLQFMVDADFHREFKTYATAQGIKMSDLFKDMYALYRREHD